MVNTPAMQHRRKKPKAGKARRTRQGTAKAGVVSINEEFSAAVDKHIAEQLAEGIGDKSFSPEDRTCWRIVRDAICCADSVPCSTSLLEDTTEPTFELHHALCRQFAAWRRLRTFLEQLFRTMLPGVLELWRVPFNHSRQADLDNLPASFADEWRATIFPNATVTRLITELIPEQEADLAPARQDFWTIARAIRNDDDLRNALLVLSHNDRSSLFSALKQLLDYLSKRTADPHLPERDVLLMNATVTIDEKTKTPYELRKATRKRLVQEVFQVLKRDVPDLDSPEFRAAETRLHRVLVSKGLRQPKGTTNSVK